MPFRLALSGLHAAQTDLKVTGNNIANSQTMGFKASRAEFVDVYAAAYGAISNVTNGSGTRTANIRQMFSQGNVEYTDNSTDLAITGQGFFVVQDDKGRYLTRNGQFGLDRDGKVVNSAGQVLQVYPPVVSGTETTFNTGSLVDLKLKNSVGSPVATSKVDINVNIDANATVFDVSSSAAAGQEIYDPTAAPIPFDKNDPTTFNHVTATTLYDSLGAAHIAQFYFRKVDDGTGLTNTWQVLTYVDGNEIPPASDGTAGGPAEAGPTTAAVLQFNSDGTIQDATYATSGPSPAVPINQIAYSGIVTGTGAANIDFTMNFSDVTQFGSDFAVNTLSQDGFTTGRLAGFDVEENGIVYARYTNGNAEILGMVSMANVTNPQGLRQKGDNLWVETFDAGDTTLGQPGAGSMGLIQAGALEASTVEIADELVDMIIAQRNYQANAQVISTADQLTQTLLNIR